MDKRGTIFLFFRYLLLIILAIPNLYLFYLVFTPLTVYPTLWSINYLYGAIFYPPTVIFFNGYYAELVPACIAGAAYYLLLILNLTTPMPVKKRIWSIIFLFGSFLILNIIRILLFAALFARKGFEYYDFAHSTTWYFGSTALVVIIWFANILIFRIRAIPIYSDLKSLTGDIFKSKK